MTGKKTVDRSQRFWDLQTWKTWPLNTLYDWIYLNDLNFYSYRPASINHLNDKDTNCFGKTNLDISLLWSDFGPLK